MMTNVQKVVPSHILEVQLMNIIISLKHLIH